MNHLKAQWICLLCVMLLLSACSSRSADLSEPAAASVSEESSLPSAPPESEPPSAPESQVDSDTESEPESEEEAADAIPAPILTDTEKEMLSANVSLYAHFIGPAEAASADAISKDTVLSAVLAEIERSKDFNAYLFEQDADGNDQVPVTLVAETAMRLFGLSEFTHTESASYNSGKDYYQAQPVEIAAAEMSEIQGAPDGNVTYTVTFPEGDFLYTGTILRQNGMPYLRFLSSEKI